MLTVAFGGQPRQTGFHTSDLESVDLGRNVGRHLKAKGL
jgi:hypothetical protein